MAGIIEAVCLQMLGGIPKTPQPYVTVGQWGLVGDYHNREMRPSFSKPGTYKPNLDRHISIVAIEVLHELGIRHLGKVLEAGALAENLTVRGLGDLSQIKVGALLQVGEGVVLRVTQYNAPCKNVRAKYGLPFYTAVAGKRGLLCSIERGVGHTIKPGDSIEVLGGGVVVEASPSPQNNPRAEAREIEPA